MKKILSIIFFLFLSIAAFSQQTMYWIGGAGNWDDLSHWSFQSGSQGSTIPSSIPTPNTHVVFDAASGLTGTSTAATRNVNIRLDNYTILSVTFAADLGATTSPRIITTGNYSLFVKGDVTLQQYVHLNFNGNNNMGLKMMPGAGETSTLTLNGIATSGVFNSLSKQGLGTTNVIGNMNTSYLRVETGTLNYAGTTFSGYLFAVTNNAKLTMPNCTAIALTGDFTLATTEPLSLPALQTFSMANSASINTQNSTLNLADGAIVTTNISWAYAGNINPGTTEFRILNGNFSSKAGSVINKVVIKNPTTTADIYGNGSTINELVFETAGGYLRNTMTIGKLRLAPSSSNTIINNGIITITQSLTDNTPNCTPNYSIMSSATGNVGYLNNNTGTDINLTNATITRINSNGTKGFIVNGIDGGDNLGSFTFVEPPAKTIYWVGATGDGEWNNQANWSATSGGAGGYCLPSRYDNVIFDHNSVITAGTVKVTANSASFHDITVQNNAPVFNFIRGGTVATAMICYGSWYMRSGMVITTDNVQFLSKDLGETITSNGSLFRLTFFQGTGGWTLQDDFQTEDFISYHLYFRGGTLNTNGKKVFIGGRFSGAEAMNPNIQRNLILGGSEVSVYDAWLYNYNSPANTLNAGTSHIILRYGNDFRGYTGHVYYDVTSNTPTPTTPSTLTVVGTNVKYHNFHIFNSTADFQSSGIVANEIRMMLVQQRADLLFRGHVTANILELQKNGILRVFNNMTVTVNQNFITHTADCQGLMEMYVDGKVAGQKFTFKSANNVHVPNVWMTGVTADLSTGATYTATGVKDIDVTNWTFTTQPAKELYWIGVNDDNWNNGLNWTTNSDGTPSVGSCVPTKFDNVHFNSHSANGVNGLVINILDAPAFFNNMTTHSDAPAGLRITYYSLAQTANAYGNYLSMGQDMIITQLNHYGTGTVEIVGATAGESNIGNLVLTTNTPAQVWNLQNNLRVNATMQVFGGTVNIARPAFYVGNDLMITDGTFNVPASLQVVRSLTFTKGTIKAINSNINIGLDFLSNSSVAGNLRSLNITNSTVDVNRDWFYNNLAGITLQATGSVIKVGRLFRGLNGHTYHNIETKAFDVSFQTVEGNLTINELTLNHSRTITGNNTIGILKLMPKGLTLTLANGTTQTITGDLAINGTPCQPNTLRASTISTGANIAYANPNNHNRFDFLGVGGINATNANLEFDVNSGSLGSNNSQVVFLTGTPGVVGLGPDKLGVYITANPSTYTISAAQFYGGVLSTYKWYKKNGAGVFVALPVPLTTVAIDVRSYGLGGVYKVEVVYDTTLPATQYCTQNDEITVSYIQGIRVNPRMRTSVSQ
ncbi:MAG: hypothetical protein EOP54_08965 [Sphingobacteriales bacterium]|nr:MAG: hypothetical protein EOP54_08965 [Sphingobacteriales bacterium]